MYISRLFIKNFRNFRHLDLDLSSGVTCIIGENNSGKTNLCHALRLVLDGTLSTQRRKLKPEDLSVGLSFCSPEQVLISVEFSDFAGKPNEEALLLEGVFADNKARITYRYRPNASVRAEHAETNLADYPTNLVDDDYTWEMVGGGEGDVILNEVSWHDSFGVRFHSESLQQGYLVVFMEALRDVEAKLSVSRTSPLQQILQQCDIPAEEQETLVGHLREANEQINASQSIQGVGTDLTASFRKAAGKTYAMGVTLGLGEPSFGDISRGLKVLLAGYGVTDLDPSRNGLGLNNVLYVSMLLNYFERRTAEGKTGGQLLLVEEPEAHLHPQLQRILLKALQERNVQVIITTQARTLLPPSPWRRRSCSHRLVVRQPIVFAQIKLMSSRSKIAPILTVIWMQLGPPFSTLAK